MPMEHYRLKPDGTKILVRGYYCATCGEPTSMLGHNDCPPNHKLVEELTELNKRETQ